MEFRVGRKVNLAVVALIVVTAGFLATRNAAYSDAGKVDTSRDRIEILELLNRHQIYIDLKEPERYGSLFAADGRYESPFASARGRDEIVAMSRGLEASGFTKNNRHYTGPAMIDIDGDKATALSYFWVANYADKTTVLATGTYRDELRKIGGQWKIVHRVMTGDAPEPAKK
jgi:hypothetical protein